MAPSLARASDENTAYSADESVSKPDPTKKAALRRHLRRFWWVYAIIVALCALTIILPIIYVAYPRIAQKSVNEVRVVISSQDYTNPSPNTVDLSLQAQFINPSPYSPRLDRWEGDLYLQGRPNPFASVTVGAFPHADNGTQFGINQKLIIKSQSETLIYTKALITSKDVTINIVGRGGLKEGGLPLIDVNYNLTATYPALDGLQNITVTNYRLASANQALPYNANAAGNVTVPNPSNLTIDLGNVSLNMTVGGVYIGNSTLPDFTIRPGVAGTYPLYSTVDQFAVAGVLSQPRWRCGVIDISLVGTERASVFDGQVVPFNTQALRELPLAVTLDLADTLKAANLSQLITGSCEK